MRDKDLRSVVLWFTVSLLTLCFVVLYILAIVDPKGYVLLFSPVAYVLVVTLFRGDKDASNGTIPLPEGPLEIAARIL